MSERLPDRRLLRCVLATGWCLMLLHTPAHAASAPRPVLFQPEAHWPDGDDSAPAFTPDGKTVFFTHRAGNASIMVATLHDGAWSPPRVARFSGRWRDIEPAMAPDGSYLVFVSNRPASPGGAPLDGYFGGRTQPGKGGNLWRVAREGDGWGAPVRLPDIVNGSSAIYSPAVAGDGSIYFNQPDPLTGKSHIYRAQARADGYDAPVALSISDGTHPGYDVAVAPDESFLVFSANRAPAAKDQSLLFVAFKREGRWSEPRAIEPPLEGIEARFSPDLRTLYFEAQVTSGATTHGRIFQVPLHALIEAKPAATKW